MIERLLIPAWNTPPRTVADWQAQLEGLELSPTIDQKDPDEIWIHLDAIGTRLLAVVEGKTLTALHAEIEAPEPSAALSLLDRAADAMGWEVHDVEEDDDEGQ